LRIGIKDCTRRETAIFDTDAQPLSGAAMHRHNSVRPQQSPRQDESLRLAFGWLSKPRSVPQP
jgi:hypothetical protein